jgi:hypothetical protein
LTPAVQRLERLRSSGVRLEPRGDKLYATPASALSPDDLAELRAMKADILAVLAPLPEAIPTLPALDPETVREVLGDQRDAHHVAMVRWDVLNTIRELERDIQLGAIAPGKLPVAGRPLGDWLTLDDVARLLSMWGERTKRAGEKS